MDLQKHISKKDSLKIEALKKQDDQVKVNIKQKESSKVFWYNKKLAQWIFCSFFPFLFLAAYPFIIQSYYTIIHVIMVLIFTQITIYKFYNQSSQQKYSVYQQNNNIQNEQHIDNQKVYLRNMKKWFLLVVLIFEALNILSKIIFVIIYYTKDDLEISSQGQKVLLDLEFFFVSDEAKESKSQKAEAILLTFIPNILLLIFFGIAKKICIYETDIQVKIFIRSPHQKSKGFLNFLVLVCLVSCQIFNPSVMAFGFFGFFLISQINNLIDNSSNKYSIQIYCFVQFFMVFFASTYTFEKNQYFDIHFLGFSGIADFINEGNTQPFYILSLCLLFLISVFYSQSLNYESQRSQLIKIYKQISQQKKQNRQLKAQKKSLPLNIQSERIKNSTQINPSVFNKPQDFKQYTNPNLETIDCLIEQDNIIIDQDGYKIANTNQNNVQQKQNKLIDLKNPEQQNYQQKSINQFQDNNGNMVNNIQISSQQSISPETKNKFQQHGHHRSHSSYEQGEGKNLIYKELKNSYLDDTIQQPQRNNQFLSVNNRLEQVTSTSKLPDQSINQKQDDEQLEKMKHKSLSLNYQDQENRELNEKNKMEGLQKKLLPQQTFQKQSINIENNNENNKNDIIQEEKSKQIQNTPTLIKEQENESYTLTERIQLWKTRAINFILDQSSILFNYIKQKFEDSILPIRFLQICSVISIMRYPCYYSLGLIIWVLLSSIIKFEIKIKFLFITIVPIPCLIVIYAFNLYGSIRQDTSLYPKHGFVFQKHFWLECILLNALIFLFFTYLIILRRLAKSLSNFKKSSGTIPLSSQINKNQVDQKNNHGHKLNTQSQQEGSDNKKQEIEITSNIIFSKQQKSPQNDRLDISPTAELSSPFGSARFRRSKNGSLQDQQENKQIKLRKHQSRDSKKKSGFIENKNDRYSIYSESKSIIEEDGYTQRGKIPIQLKPVSLITILFAILLKYSQTLALFLLYWIGFYTFNIIHLLLVLFFLIFFQNSMRTINIKKKGKIYEMSFSFQYWYLLLIYLALLIFAKFIYGIVNNDMDFRGREIENQGSSVSEFIGISYVYGMPFSLSLSSQDFAGLSIIWIAFLFATLQEDTYRSETYQKYSNKIDVLIQDIPLIKKYSPNFLIFVDKITILFKNFIYWCSLFGITTCLLLQDFSFINSILLIASFYLVFFYIFKYKDPQLFNYEKYFKLWNLFNRVIIGYILICYILQFTVLKFAEDNIIDHASETYESFNKNRAVYGFYSQLKKDESLRLKLFPIIFILFFAIYVQNYLKMISNSVKYHIDDQKREKNEKSNSVASSVIKRQSLESNVDFKVINEDDSLTFDVMNKHFQKARREENRQIYNDYVLLDLYDKEKGIYSILRLLKFLMIDVQNLFVFIFAMVFRLSISMLIFIIIYLRYYYKYHHQLQSFLDQNQMKKSIHYFFKAFQKFFSFPQKNLEWKFKEMQSLESADQQINDRRDQFSLNTESIEKKNIQQNQNYQIKIHNFQRIEDHEQEKFMNQEYKEKLKQEQPEIQQQQGKDSNKDHLAYKKRISKRFILTETLENKFQQFLQMTEKVKIDQQLAIWGYSFWFSFFCMVLTYGIQFLATDIAHSNIDLETITNIQWYLFIFGTSCNTLSLSSIFRNIYFYLLMFWMNVIIYVLIRMKKQHENSIKNNLILYQKYHNRFNKEKADDKSLQEFQTINVAQRSIKNFNDSSKRNSKLKLQKYLIPESQMKRQPHETQIKSQFNLTNKLNENQINLNIYQNNESCDLKFAFELRRVARVQEGEKEVDIQFQEHGGILQPNNIKSFQKNNHFRIFDDEIVINEEIEDDSEKNNLFDSQSNNINQKQNNKINSIYENFQNPNQQRKGTLDGFKFEENNIDEQEQSEEENDNDDQIDEGGSLDLKANKLGVHSEPKTKAMRDLNNKSLHQNNNIRQKNYKGNINQLKNDLKKNRNLLDRQEEKQRQEEKIKQRNQFQNDCDFVYNNYLRIQYFYEMKTIYIKEKCKASLLLSVYPIYTVILLHVSEQKHDIFSYIYLIAAFMGTSIKVINKNTVFLVLLQYILLLLNITQENSPLKIDSFLLEFRSMSFIQRYITDEELLQYLAFGKNHSSSATVSFMLNSFVFFIIGIYFHCYKYIIRSLLNNINSIKNKVRQIYEYRLFPKHLSPILSVFEVQKNDNQNQELIYQHSAPNLYNRLQNKVDRSSEYSNEDQLTNSFDINNQQDYIKDNVKEKQEIINTVPPIWINYQNWKSTTFIRVNLFYEMIISFGYIICAILIMIISCQYLDIFNFIILAYTLVVFFITEFIVPYPQMLTQKNNILNILKVLQFYLFTIFALYSTMQIPYVKQDISAIGEFLSNQFIELKVIDKIYIMFFILCTKQLMNSDDFKTITYSVSQSYILSQNLSHKATSTFQNDIIISELLQNEKERRHLRDIVKKVTQTLKNWHKAQSYFSSNFAFAEKNMNMQQPMITSQKQSMNNNPMISMKNSRAKTLVPSGFSKNYNVRQNGNIDEQYTESNEFDSNNNLNRNKQKPPLQRDLRYRLTITPKRFQNKIKTPITQKSPKFSHESNTSAGLESSPESAGRQKRIFSSQKDKNQNPIKEQISPDQKNENKEHKISQSQSEINLDNMNKEGVDAKNKGDSEYADYSLDESISDLDEPEKNFDYYLKQENPKFISGKLQSIPQSNRNYRKQEQQIDEQSRNSNKLRIGRVSSIDHLDQTFQFDSLYSPVRNSQNFAKKEIKSETNLIQSHRNQRQYNQRNSPRKITKKKMTFKDEKEDQANRYHNTEKIEPMRKYTQESDESKSENEEQPSEILDQDKNDIIDQIKQNFEKKFQKEVQKKENSEKQLKSQKQNRFALKLCKLFESQINPFMFMDSIQMADYILENNSQVFSKIFVSVDDLLLNNYTSIMEYSHLLSIVYYCLYQTIQEAGIEFVFNNLFAIIQRATECDITSLMIYNNLIQTSSLHPTIPYHYYLRQQQEKNIDDKKILEKEQLKNLNHICIYHSQIPIYFFNVKYPQPKMSLMFRFIDSFIKMLLSNWHLVCFFFFIIYYFSNSGIMSLPFPCFVFLFFFIDKRFISLKIWMISFAYVSILLFFKFIIQIEGINMDPDLQVTFFNDNLNFSYEGYMIFLILVASVISKYMGLDKEDIYNSENTHQSYVRKCINDLEFRHDFIENYSKETEQKKSKLSQKIELSTPNLKKYLNYQREGERKVIDKNLNYSQFDNMNKFDQPDGRIQSEDNLQNIKDDSKKNSKFFFLGKQARDSRQGDIEEGLPISSFNSIGENTRQVNEDYIKSKHKQNNIGQRQSQLVNQRYNQSQQQEYFNEVNNNYGQDFLIQSNQYLQNQDNLEQSNHLQKINQLSTIEKIQSQKEKSYSMHEQMISDLKNKPTLLLNQQLQKENYFQRVFNAYNKRPGRDFYPWIALIQIIILLFIFIFFTRIDQNNNTGFNDQIKYNQFSGSMVICLFIQVAFMVMERYLALRKESDINDSKTKKKKQKKKKSKKKSSKKQPFSSSSSSSQNSSDSSKSSNIHQISQSYFRDSNIDKQQGWGMSRNAEQHDESDIENQRKVLSQQNLQNNQGQDRRSAQNKKDKENFNIYRPSIKSQLEYESYRNFQEMHSQILNQDDDDDTNKHQFSIFSKSPRFMNEDEYSNQYSPFSKRDNTPQYQGENNLNIGFVPKNQMPKKELTLKINTNSPSNQNQKIQNENDNNNNNHNDNAKKIQLQKLRRLSKVLRDEVIFANLEKKQINANLNTYKEFNKHNTQKKEPQQLSCSSEDEFQSINQSVSQKQQNNEIQSSNINKVNKDKQSLQDIQSNQIDLNIQNEKKIDDENLMDQENSNLNNKNQDKNQTYQSDEEIKLQADKTQATKTYPYELNNSESFDSSPQNNRIRNSFENNKSDDSITRKQKKKKLKKNQETEKLTLTNELLKYIQMAIFTILFCWFIFFYVPKSFQSKPGEDGSTVIRYTTNGYLTGFVFIVFIYMLISTLQIRYGYKKLKLRNTILQTKSKVAGFYVNVLRAIPFLQELKTMLDWTITKTSLSLASWFLLEDIHYSLYRAKLSSLSVKGTSKVGRPQSKAEKIFQGLLSVIGILLLIFGPMLIFSTLNPISGFNRITGGQLEVGLEFIYNSQLTYYPLFQNTHINNLSEVSRSCSYDKEKKGTLINEDGENCFWDKHNFKSVSIIQDADNSQFQEFDIYSYSERNWDISKPSRIDIKNKFADIVDNPNSELKVRFLIKLQLLRENQVTCILQNLSSIINNSQKSELNSVPYTAYYPDSDFSNSGETDSVDNTNRSDFLSKEMIKQLQVTFFDCSKAPVLLPNFYVFVFSSTTENKSYVSEPIIQRDSNNKIMFTSNAYIDLICDDDTGNNDTFWNLAIDPNMKQGLMFFTLTDKFSNVTFGFSIITLYTSVILVIGKFIRDSCKGNVEKVFIKCMPNPDQILRLCEAISNARNEKDLFRERIFYAELMDLIRSPEVLKKLTGSYSNVLNEKYKIQVEYEEKEKLFYQKRKLQKQKTKLLLKEQARKTQTELNQEQEEKSYLEINETPQMRQNDLNRDARYSQIEERVEEEDQEDNQKIKMKQ